jgi:hypothetical protein
MKTEQEIRYFAAVAEQVEEGTINPLTAYIQLRYVKEGIEAAIKSIEEAAIEETRKYGKEEIMNNGAVVRLVEGTPRYSYKNIPQWNVLKGKMAKIEELAKVASKGMKGYIVDENGEEIPAADVTYSRPYITLKKIPRINMEH